MGITDRLWQFAAQRIQEAAPLLPAATVPQNQKVADKAERSGRRSTFDRQMAPPDVWATADAAYDMRYSTKFIKILPNPDEMLKRRGLDQMTYSELRQFPIVKTSIARRKYGVLKDTLDVDRDFGETPEAKFIKEQVIAKLNLNRIINDILDAPQFGYRIQEVYWNERGGMMLPTEVKAKPNDWFGFDAQEQLRFKTREQPINGEVVPARKFLVTKHEADQFERPYGEPILASCFWSVHFMKGGQKLYMKFLQKYGMPYLHGKVRRGSDTEDFDELFDYLEQLQQDGVVVTPDDQDINIIDASGKASAELWRGLREDMRADIIELELGHEGAVAGTPGKLGSDTTALEVSKDIALADQGLVCQTLNTLFRWVIDANFWSPSHYPTAKFYAQESIDTDRALRDSYLLKNPRLAFTSEYYQDVYGFKPEHIELVSSAAPASATQAAETTPAVETPAEPIESFADKLTTADQMAIDTAIAKLSKESQSAVAEMLAPMIKVIHDSKSFGEANRRLTSLMSELPDDNLRAILFNAIFGSKVIGHASAQMEDANASN